MEKPQLITLDPANLKEELRGPVLHSLIERGWTVAATLLLEDPARPEHSRVRVGLVMFPPRPGAGDRVALDPMDRLVIWLAGLYAVASTLGVLWHAWGALSLH